MYYIKQKKTPPYMNPYVTCIIVGLFYGGWPVLAKWSGAKPFWIAFAVALMTALFIGAIGHKGFATPIPTGKMLMLLMVAGLMNGVATWYYGSLVGTPGWDVSTLVPVSMMILLLTSALAGMTFLGEPISVRKIVGLILAIPAIWLMSK